MTRPVPGDLLLVVSAGLESGVGIAYAAWPEPGDAPGLLRVRWFGQHSTFGVLLSDEGTLWCRGHFGTDAAKALAVAGALRRS